MSVSVPDTDTDNFLKSENGLSGSEENRKSVKKCPSIRPMTFDIEKSSQKLTKWLQCQLHFNRLRVLTWMVTFDIEKSSQKLTKWLQCQLHFNRLCVLVWT